MRYKLACLSIFAAAVLSGCDTVKNFACAGSGGNVGASAAVTDTIGDGQKPQIKAEVHFNCAAE